MPPHLHPRSRLTSSLFATTLFASFFVVALPHALPCPAPRIAYSDEKQVRRRRRKCPPATEDEDAHRSEMPEREETARSAPLGEKVRNADIHEAGIERSRVMEMETVREVGDEVDVEDETNGSRGGREREKRTGRECPIPKPSGVLGEMLSYGLGLSFKSTPPSTPTSARTGEETSSRTRNSSSSTRTEVDTSGSKPP